MFYGSVSVPSDKETGSYQMTVSLPDANTAYGSFQIQEYRKPEFQVEVKSDLPRIVAAQRTGQGQSDLLLRRTGNECACQVFRLFVGRLWAALFAHAPSQILFVL